jgi:tetratricopeptide (TPR) repeat protein
MPEPGERISSLKLRISARPSVAEAQIEALLGKLEETTDARERAKLLVDVALGLRDDLGDSAQALEALIEAFAADPTYEPILDHLEPLARAQDRWVEVLATVQKLVTTDRDRARATVYAETMVRWYTREVPNPDAARAWVESVRKLDSTHALVHMMQAAVSREHGDLKRELDELDLAVLSTRRADDRARIHLLMAQRFGEDRTKNPAQAKKHYAAAHKLFPRTMEPLLGLERLALGDGDKLALADVLRKQADAEISDPERVAILLRLARLEEQEFKKPDLAAKTLERVVALAEDTTEAFDALERCYQAARAWPELSRVLELGAAEATDPALRSARLKRLGDVLESKLGDVRSALATYERLAQILPDDETVLGELARLAEKVGDVPLAVRSREKLALLAREPAQAARMYVIAGQLLLPTDGAAARRQFERATAVDPSSQAAWSALLWDARAEGDHARAGRYLEERARRTELPRARAAAFVELAEHRAKLGDPKGARDAFERAAEADANNEAAASALVDALVAEGRFAEADALVDVAVAAAERDKDTDRVFSLRRAQAVAAQAVGRPDRALAAARAAHEARPESIEASEAFIDAAFAMRADPLVLSAREPLTFLADRPDGLSVAARVLLADVLIVTGDADRAACLYDDVLAEAPENEGALAGLAQHHVAQGNPVAALSLKRQRARGEPDEAARFAAFVAIGDDFAGKAGDDALAAEVYEEARALRPKDLPVLHKLLAVYQKLGKWASLFDVLRGIAAADADPTRRTKTLFTMAQLAKDQLADRGTALDLYDQALDADPSNLKAFERIVAMLTEDRDWLGLEQMYRRMIVRTKARGSLDDPESVKLLHALDSQLGLVYRDRLRRPEEAIALFQEAVQLRPDDDQGQTILRELLSRMGQADSAVMITIDRVQRDPLYTAPYPALFDLLVQQNARDRALCVASAMRFLDVTHPAATGLLAAYPQPPIEGIVLDLGPEGWRALLHEALDPQLTDIFEVISPAVVDIALSRLSLRDRLSYPGPPLKGNDWLPRMVARAAAILGAAPPRVYARRTPGPPLTHVPARPAALLAYPPAFGGVAADVLAFLVGKRVLEASPALLARALHPSITELKALGASAARVATGQTEPGDAPLRDRLTREQVARLGTSVELAMAKTGKLDVLR